MKKVLTGLTIAGVLYLIFKPRLPKFKVEYIRKGGMDPKEIGILFDGDQRFYTQPGQSFSAISKNKYVLVGQGDQNGVLYTLYKDDKKIKQLPVRYDQSSLPNSL